MRAVKKVIVLLSAVVLGCACLFTVGCANEELLQKIDSLAEKVETLEGENTSLTEKLGELQTENDELAEKIGDITAEQEQQKLETANCNMIVFDRWPRNLSPRGCCIIFNHPDPEITFECTVQKGTICIWNDYSQDARKKAMICKDGDIISWTMPSGEDWGYDFIDVLIKKGDKVLGYAVIDIVAWIEHDDEKILTCLGHIPSILSSYLPVYYNEENAYRYGEYTYGYGEPVFVQMMEQAKEIVSERNKALDEIFRKHFEYYDSQKESEL